jgi:hypothetical protein
MGEFVLQHIALAILAAVVVYFICVWVYNYMAQKSFPAKKQVRAGEYLCSLTHFFFFGFLPVLVGAIAFSAVGASMSLCAMMAKCVWVTSSSIITHASLVANAAIRGGLKRTTRFIDSGVIIAKGTKQQLAGLVLHVTLSAVALLVVASLALIK